MQSVPRTFGNYCRCLESTNVKAKNPVFSTESIFSTLHSSAKGEVSRNLLINTSSLSNGLFTLSCEFEVVSGYVFPFSYLPLLDVSYSDECGTEEVVSLCSKVFPPLSVVFTFCTMGFVKNGITLRRRSVVLVRKMSFSFGFN